MAYCMTLNPHSFDVKSLYFNLHLTTTIYNKKINRPFRSPLHNQTNPTQIRKKPLFLNLHYITTIKTKINHLLLHPWSTCRVWLEKCKWITTSTFTIYFSINFSLNIWHDWWDVLIIISYFIITFQNEHSCCEVKGENRNRNGNYGHTFWK